MFIKHVCKLILINSFYTHFQVHQLTGFSDPVYAEAFVSVNQFDISLDVLLVNQTNDTLQNLTLELSTLGDHKLLEKPRPITLAAQDFANVCAKIKVGVDFPFHFCSNIRTLLSSVVV